MSVLRRLPFTLAFMGVVSAVALGASGPGLTARPEAIARWGWALHDLWDGTFWSLGTAVVWLHRPDRLPLTLAFLAATLGAAEWRAGTRRALAVFWVGDVLATLALALGVVLPLYLAGTTVGATLAFADDVGVSGGAFACLGAVVRRLPRWRAPAVALLCAGLAAAIALPGALEADLLHAVAFPLGWALDAAFARRAERQRARPRHA